MRKFLTLTAAAAFALAGTPNVAQAGDVSCGDNLTADTTLHENLTCTTTPGLIIDANGITLDLGGFTLSGATCGGCHGVRIVGFDDVQIENGTVDGFEQGVRAEGVSGLELKHLILTGQTSSHAIDILDSSDVVIKSSSFTLGTSFIGPEAIRLESVDGVKVENVDVHGGFIGVNFACGLCDGTEVPTNGEVKASTFSATFIGVLIANSTDAKVEDNHISDGVTVVCPVPFCGGSPVTLDSKGVSAGGFGPPVTGAEIKDNHVHDNDGIGIRLVGVTDSKVSRNHVRDNDEGGIVLVSGSTGNEIKSNFATGNGGFDMSHDGGSTPNEWEGNTCGSSDGAEIDCP